MGLGGLHCRSRSSCLLLSFGYLSFVLVVNLWEVVYVLLLFPWSPNKIDIWGKVFLGTLLPPVALFKYAFDDWKVIAGTDEEFLSLVNFFSIRWTSCQCLVTKHISLNYTYRQVIGWKNSLVKQTLHLVFDIEYKLTTVKELSKRRLGVELSRYVYTDLFR